MSHEPEVTGLLAPPKNDVAFADAIDRILANPSWRDELGKAGRERVEIGHLMKNGRFINTLIVRISVRKGTRRHSKLHSKFLEDKYSYWVLLKTYL